MIQKIQTIFVGALVLVSVSASAETQNFRMDNTKVKSAPIPAPNVNELWKKWPQPPISFVQGSSSSRTLASERANRMTGSEDLMSKPLKTFRDKLLAARDPETLAAILKEYDEGYDTNNYPNDLKYVIARLAPFRSMRGFIWRMAPLVHQSVITQESLLGMVRSFAEQVMIFEPDTQWEAYIAFLAIPDAHLLETRERHDNKCEKAHQDSSFCVENDVADFLASEVYQKLNQASTRLLDLVKNTKLTVETDGREHPIVFDNKIRYGQDSFSNWDFASKDRFKIVGAAECYSAVARFQRRMAFIAQVAAYNWNGNIELRHELGTHIGIDATQSGLFGGSNAFSLEGMTREERVTISRKHQGVFALRSKGWMPVAYYNLHNYAYYTAKAWSIIRKESDESNYLLDPELFQGRKDQIDKGITNLMAMLPDPNKKGMDDASRTQGVIGEVQGAITGRKLHVNFMAFFNNPPEDLHELMPTVFYHHQDIRGLAQVYSEFNAADGDSQVSMKIGEKPATWRNYFYGRAVGWNSSGDFKRLFPDVARATDVAEAQRTLAETRGGRPLLNSLTIFVK